MTHPTEKPGEATSVSEQAFENMPPVEKLVHLLKRDMEVAAYYHDPEISRNQRKVGITLFTQYVMFIGIWVNIITENNEDNIAANSAFMIVLGVVGIGLAKWRTSKLQKFYSDSYENGEVTRVKNLLMACVYDIKEDTPDRDRKIKEAIDNYNEIGRLRDITKHSLKRLESATGVLWFSELFFITVGTLYSGFGKEVLAYIHG